MNVLVIDNIDSFVYNLVQYIGEQGVNPIVHQNTAGKDVVEKAIVEDGIDGIIISPGPKRPEDAGVSNHVIREYGPKLPILGVCLGHQCIGHVFGGKIRRAKTLMHGKISSIEHDGSGVLKDIPSPLEATRYHSLVVDDETLPDCLKVTATSLDDKEIMGLTHKEYPIYGLQFHPESILTVDGMEIMKNFIGIMKEWKSRK
jgi:anthranilate synthase/aminodeoxychorismate synthase-like glutamine amidotransferase